MTEKRYDVIYEKEPRGQVVTDNGIPCTARTCVTRLNRLTEENEELKKELHKIKVVNEMLSMDFANSEHELYKENEQLKKENQRMTDKLNELALEFLNHDIVTMGKATEISEMCYYDFIYMKGMLEIGGMQTQLIANIGKRQAYQEVLEFIRKEQME